MGFTSLGEIVKNCFETKFTILVYIRKTSELHSGLVVDQF